MHIIVGYLVPLPWREPFVLLWRVHHGETAEFFGKLFIPPVARDLVSWSIVKPHIAKILTGFSQVIYRNSYHDFPLAISAITRMTERLFQ